jgi:hypothetical protein
MSTIIKFYKYGTVGDKGERGSEQLYRNADPLPTDGQRLDTWKNKRTGDVFKKIDTITWEFVGTGETLSEVVRLNFIDEQGNLFVKEDGDPFFVEQELTYKNLIDTQANYLIDEKGARYTYGGA